MQSPSYRSTRRTGFHSLGGWLLVATAATTFAVLRPAAPEAAVAVSTNPSALASAPTDLEELVADQLAQATGGIDDVALSTVTELFTVRALGGPNVTASLIVQYGGFPDAVPDADGTYGPLAVGYVPSTQGLDPNRIAAVTAGIAAMLQNDDVVCWIEWTGVDTGNFTSVTVANADGVVYDTFASNMPATWPLDETSLPSQLWFQDSDDGPWSGFTWPITNGFGVEVVKIIATAQAVCLNGKVLNCTTESSVSSSFLWEGKVEKDCKVIKNPNGDGTECCLCEVSAGYASGFTSVEVEAGGFKLKVTGSLGCAGVFNKTLMTCCSAK